MTETVETYFERGAWHNWTGGTDVGGPHESRDAAIAEGRREAADRGAEHVVRDERATVVDRGRPGAGEE